MQACLRPSERIPQRDFGPPFCLAHYTWAHPPFCFPPRSLCTLSTTPVAADWSPASLHLDDLLPGARRQQKHAVDISIDGSLHHESPPLGSHASVMRQSSWPQTAQTPCSGSACRFYNCPALRLPPAHSKGPTLCISSTAAAAGKTRHHLSLLPV